jgi:hypothetical protein
MSALAYCAAPADREDVRMLNPTRTLLASLVVLCSALPGCGSGDPATSAAAPRAAAPACGSETFASDLYAAGSINGQNGWFSDPASAFDEAIVDLGAAACRGKGVWRIGNLVTSGAFGNQPISPALAQSAGESTVRTPGGGDSMQVSFFFRSVAAAADGSAVTLSLSPTSADRQNYLRFVNDDDADGGLQIFAIDGVNLDQVHPVKSAIGRGQWHHVRIVARAVDGLNPDGSANDVVEVFFDGVLASSHSTWEAWRAALPATTLAVDRALFRLSSAASTFGAFAAPAGFYFDDYRQRVFNGSTPAVVIGEYVTGFELP